MKSIHIIESIIHTYATDVVAVHMHGLASSITESSALLLNWRHLREFVVVSLLTLEPFPINSIKMKFRILTAVNNRSECYLYERFIPMQFFYRSIRCNIHKRW